METTAPKFKKGLSVPKATAAKGIEQRHLFLLYRSVVLSVTDYGPGLTTMALTNLLKLDRVQNEAMRVILGTTQDTPTEALRFMLDLPPMKTRQKVEQVKAYFSAVEIPTTHSTKPWKTQRDADWDGLNLGWVKQRNQYCKYARTQANQGVGKVPETIPASLRNSARKLERKHYRKWP